MDLKERSVFIIHSLYKANTGRALISLCVCAWAASGCRRHHRSRLVGHHFKVTTASGEIRIRAQLPVSLSPHHAESTSSPPISKLKGDSPNRDARWSLFERRRPRGLLFSILLVLWAALESFFSLSSVTWKTKQNEKKYLLVAALFALLTIGVDC